MFFEKKQTPAANAAELFSMEKIGRQIMHARKKKGMTQMELADRMGISFQAVSNWERGLSCPDISKLFELSGLFDVSIDDLLGNKRAAQIATEIQDGTPPALPVEELTEVAPLLDQAQADQVMQVMQKSLIEEGPKEQEAPPETTAFPKDRVDAIISLLPYASEDTVGKLATTVLKETRDLEKLVPFLDYLSEDAVGELAITYVNATHSLEKIQPLLDYMTEDAVGEVAIAYVNGTHSLEQIQPLLDYMTEDAVGELAIAYVNGTHSLTQIPTLLDYMPEDAVAELASVYLNATRDLEGLRPLLDYMDEGAVDELLRSFLK